MNILGLFHLQSVEAVQQSDSDLVSSKAACERQHKALVSLGEEMKELYADKDELTNDVAFYKADSQRAEAETEEARKDVRAAIQDYTAATRQISILKGQITKLKKKLKA